MITLWDQNYLQEQQTGQPVHPGNYLSSGMKPSPGAMIDQPVHPGNWLSLGTKLSPGATDWSTCTSR